MFRPKFLCLIDWGHHVRGVQFMFSYCISGGFGVDFSSDPDKLEEGLKTVAKGLLQHGVTSYCPTIVTSSQESYSEFWLIDFKEDKANPWWS